MSNTTKTIYLYGMGKVGIRTYLTLKDKGILVEGFIDSSPQKQGRTFEGVKCISLEQFRATNIDDAYVIVALENDKSVVEYLKSIEIPNLILREDISQILEIECEPITDITILEETFQAIYNKELMGVHNNENITIE